MPDYDWNKIRREYIEAPSEQARPSLNALADKYGCGRSTLKIRSQKEDWKGQAAEFIRSGKSVASEPEKVKVRLEPIPSDLSWDEQCYLMAQQALQRLQESLAEDLSVKNIDDFSRALERIHKVGKAAIADAPTEIEAAADPSQYDEMDAGQLAQLYQERMKG